MRTFAAVLILSLGAVFVTGCSPAFWGGAAAGAIGAGAGYEYTAKRQLDRLNEDYRAGKITPEEYEARKKAIQGGSIIY